ncbi:hypothetical protein EDB89DRAFT_1908400 [Lactarius sanguifluus]|nr:hypothetical protein EDB89DRAFT_1908400 [Lactarius sanguifluus]
MPPVSVAAAMVSHSRCRGLVMGQRNPIITVVVAASLPRRRRHVTLLRNDSPLITYMIRGNASGVDDPRGRFRGEIMGSERERDGRTDGRDGMDWDGMGWDGMGWDGMGWDGKARECISTAFAVEFHGEAGPNRSGLERLAWTVVSPEGW